MLASKSTTALPHARRALLVSHHMSSGSPPPQRNPTLVEYATAVSHGLLSWGDHLATTSLRLSLPPPPPGTILAPSVSNPPLVTMSYLARLITLLHAHYHWLIAPRLSQRCHAWRECGSTAGGVLILRGNQPSMLAVDGSPAHGSLPT